MSVHRQEVWLAIHGKEELRPAGVDPLPDPAWLAWNDGTVARLARAIRDGYAWDRLPVLADALEEAGCDNAAVLDHCRSAFGHERNCWVVDLLTGMG